MDKIHARIQESVYTKVEWEAANPVLLKGEKGFVSDDPNLFKIGDGVTAWNSLPWRGYTGTIAQVAGDNENAVMSQKATSLAIQTEAQERNEADEQLNAAIAAEKKRAEAAEQAIIYDVSAHNNGKVFESLSALLSSDNLSTLIPTSVRHRGMTIRFIQGSDNRYVQYRLMDDDWSADTDDWAIADEGVYVENPEFVYIKTDAKGKILWAIKIDGGIYYGAGVPQQVIDYVEKKLAELSLDEYEDIVAFLSDYLGSDTTLKVLIDEINAAKVDKVEGKTLIDAEYASSQSAIENLEFLEVTTDSEDKVLEGIKTDGTKVIELPLEIQGVSQETIDNPEFIQVTTDSEGKMVEAIRKDGKKIFFCGVEVLNGLNFNTAIGEYLNLESLSLTERGINKLKQDLINAGFNPTPQDEDAFEIAIGKQKSYGTYQSELDACPIVNNENDFYTGFKTINKDKTEHNTNKAFVVFNHDDGHPCDLKSTRRIYNKYGYKASICGIFYPFAYLADAKEIIPNFKKWINDGHEVGLHAVMNCSYWIVNRLYDIRPDGTTSFAPIMEEIRGSNIDGTGTNAFGRTITAETTLRQVGISTIATYQSENYDTKVVESTQQQLDDILRGFCFYGDRYTLRGFNDLDVDIETATVETITPVWKTRIQWLEYYYNKLVDDTIGFSSDSQVIADRFAEDYDTGNGLGTYPDAEHILNGKMVYYGDTSNPHFNDNEYQKVGRFTKGIYKGCFSCCNWEVIDRCIEVAQAFFRHYYGLNHFTDIHRHGVAYIKDLLYTDNGIHYINREKTILNDSHEEFYVSHKDSWCSYLDICHEFGIDLLKENTFRDWLDVEGQIGFFMGQPEMRTQKGFGGTGDNGRYGDFTDYLAMFGTSESGMENMTYETFMSFMKGVDNWFKFCYENAGNSVTRNGITMNVYDYIRSLVKNFVASLGSGKVMCISVDTIGRSPAISCAVELVLRFFKDNNVEVLSYNAGKEKILSMERYAGGNLFPNPGFNQSLLNYLGGSSSDKDAYIPDGWIYVSNGGSETYHVEVEEINGVNTKVFTINGRTSIQTNVFGIPQGRYKLSYDIKSSDDGSVNFRSAKIGDKKGHYTTINDYTPTVDWTTKEVEFSIDDYHRNMVDKTNPISIICDGYEDNIFKLMFRLNSSSVGNILKIANVKIIKL